jgi:hypothetical protein
MICETDFSIVPGWTQCFLTYSCDVSAFQPCNRSETDTPILQHMAHTTAQGHRTVYVRPVNSDVVVLAIRFFAKLGLAQLWVGFGTRQTFSDIPIHDVCSNLGTIPVSGISAILRGCHSTSKQLRCG